MSYVIEQQALINLLTTSGINPEDVQTLHLNLEDSWAEVAVKDEKGNRVVEYIDDKPDGFATTIIPVFIRSRYNGEII